ncbi:MAG: peptidylprolyl isomerase [Siphonobacter sp.]
MYKTFWWITLLLVTVTLTSHAQQDPVLITIGPKKVTVSEFLYHFKNNPVGADSLLESASPQDYLPFFINYKLKVLAGERLGIDTTAEFREELDGYRRVAAQTFLTDKGVVDKLITEAYNRLKEEVNASHILISLNPGASPEDTLKTYNEALTLRNRILKGEKFETIAREYSKDPFVAQNNGNLGWFTALQMVYPFESTAYRLKEGEISMPVRTKFGYHLIRLNDRRTSQGSVQVAHLFVRVAPNATENDKLAAKTKIEEAYATIQKGLSFEKAVMQFSEDASTRNAGGVMNPFGIGKMLPAFEEAAFSLKKENAYTLPFETSLGWHILKLVRRIPVPEFDEIAGYIRTKVRSDERSGQGKSAIVRRLKQENKYEENTAAVNAAIEKANSLLPDAEWQIPADASLNGQLLFRIGDQVYRVRDFFDYVQKAQKPMPAAGSQVIMRQLFKEFSDEKNLEYEQNHLEQKNKEYRDLIEEYHDGMILYQMMDEHVQSKSLTDTVAIRRYFEQNRDKYQMPPRIHALVLDAANRAVLDAATRMLAKKPYSLNQKVTDLTFTKGQTQLNLPQQEKLYDLIMLLSTNPDYQLEISGHSDATEADSCSAGRLKAVVNHLVRRGNISPTRLVEIDEGRFKPASTTDREKNRRVSFVLSTNSKIDVARRLNSQKADNLFVEEGDFRKGDNKFADEIEWKVGKQVITKGGRTVSIDIQRVDSARPKTLAEARGFVINDYQDFLEKSWIEALKKQFPVSVDEVELKKLK